MRRLRIIGAGGLGRELLSYIRDVERSTEVDWVFDGFLDDRQNPFDSRAVDARRVGPISGHVPHPNDVYISGIGDSRSRMKIAQELESQGAQFLNLIHPTATLRERISLGRGVVIGPFVRINPDVTIGDHVLVNSSATIAHDVVIGRGTTLSGGNSLNGSCTIGQEVLLGANCVVLQGRRIEDHARVAAGAVVFRHVREGQTVIGNPAKVV